MFGEQKLPGGENLLNFVDIHYLISRLWTLASGRLTMQVLVGVAIWGLRRSVGSRLLGGWWFRYCDWALLVALDVGLAAVEVGPEDVDHSGYEHGDREEPIVAGAW